MDRSPNGRILETRGPGKKSGLGTRANVRSSKGICTANSGRILVIRKQPSLEGTLLGKFHEVYYALRPIIGGSGGTGSQTTDG